MEQVAVQTGLDSAPGRGAHWVKDVNWWSWAPSQRQQASPTWGAVKETLFSAKQLNCDAAGPRGPSRAKLCSSFMRFSTTRELLLEELSCAY